jgi:tetratricopeptide (TPR) repeat protein
MEAIIPLARGLLELGTDLLKRRQYSEGVRILRRLISLPGTTPADLAQANRLLAEAYFAQADFASSRTAAASAITNDPTDSEAHFLLAQATALDVHHPNPESALEHLSKAVELSPDDNRKQAALGLQLVRARKRNRGLKILSQLYSRDRSDPQIIGDYATALIEADRADDAELLVIQASDRYPGDARFRRLKQRVKQQTIRWRLERRRSRPSGGMIIPFRNFERPESNRPRGQRRPSIQPIHEQPDYNHQPIHDSPPMIASDMTLADVFRKLGRARTRMIANHIGVIGSTSGSVRLQEIVHSLRDTVFLRRLVQSLPIDSRKLLRTLVQSGGFVPANVLFQNTGPDAPPPDYVQPLLAAGLCFFGVDSNRNDSSRELVALVPRDQLASLAQVLGVKPGTSLS